MTAAPIAIAPGDVIGPYRVIAELAGGGYRAQRLGHPATYWLEVATTDWRTAAVRMMRAARVVESLLHPGVARIVDHGVDKRDGGKRAWQATELPAGVALYDVISRRVMTAAEVTKLVRDLAAVLAHAHAHGVVHGALAMRAVVIPTGERATQTNVCIADWGHPPRDIGVYAAPELAAGRKDASRDMRAASSTAEWQCGRIDGRTDVYALGVIAFRAAAGRFPVPPIDDVPGAPAGLAMLIARMLANDPAERPTAAEVGALAAELALGVTLSIEAVATPTGDVNEVIELEAFVNDDVVVELVPPRFSKPKWTPAPPVAITSDVAGTVAGEIDSKKPEA